MFTLPWELLETSYFYAVSTQVAHTSSLSPNLSFPLILPNHPLHCKKENKMAKMFWGEKKKILQHLGFQSATSRLVVECDAQVAKLVKGLPPQ